MTDAPPAAAAALADALQTRATSLAVRPLDEMYRDLFWQERFASRGRKHAEQDGLHHVTYLVEALRLGSPATLIAYARWLRTLLVAHGMCTLDLATNFGRLGAAIAAESLPDANLALAYLEAAQRALAYEHGDARAVWDAQARLEASARMHMAEPPASPWRATVASLHCDLHHLLSYLTDAVAVARPELLRAHATWAAAALRRQGVPKHVWDRLATAVTEACASEPEPWARTAWACATAAFSPQPP